MRGIKSQTWYTKLIIRKNRSDDLWGFHCPHHGWTYNYIGWGACLKYALGHASCLGYVSSP